MYSSKRNVLQLLSLLKAHNISHFVVSPGSRHIPIVISMESDPFFKLYSVVDERSASFFAVGLMQRFKEPVGIICTSGTASANYCSAINECLYQELPLLVLTADREECLRDQHEDQMIRQSTMFKPVAKFVANLPMVKSDNDVWYNNRLINEALLELTHRGCGPVQVNIPIPDHLDNFDTPELPKERKIVRNNLADTNWDDVAQKLRNKRVIIICGEGFTLTKEQSEILDNFCNTFDVAVLSDKMSNCHVQNSIENAFAVLRAVNEIDVNNLVPEIVISIRSNYSFNPESKSFFKRATDSRIENWYVHPSGKVVDPFHKLTNIFEMDEFTFCKYATEANTSVIAEQYYAETWKVMSDSIDEPKVEYGHINAVGKFIEKIPNGSILHLANSNSVRIAQLYDINPSVEIHCNRGTDGIDGSMSAAVGYACETDRLNFLMIGDLSFFYDMNALWNRHLSKNMRIFLDNNGGGAIMHMPDRPEFAMNCLPNFISAKHNASAKAWAEDRGFKYVCAHNSDEIDKGVKILTDPNIEGPVLLEVFSDLFEDTAIFKGYYATISREKLDKRLSKVSKEIARKILHALGIEPSTLKKIVGK